MSTLFATLLATHVITGLIGTFASYATTLTLLKREVIRKRLLLASGLAWVAYMTSWLSGGYYYWFWYGDKVKPVIKAGEYVWAHNIVMEAKEHIFLILPIASLAVALIAWSSTDRINSDPLFKSAVTYLAATITGIAVIIALGGVLITGGAR